MSTSRPRRFMCVVWFLRNYTEYLYVIYAPMDYSFSCVDPGIFVRGGGLVNLTKKALTTFFFFFSPQLILLKSNG